MLTGVGHEVDTSVADEVAHTAAKTPTACAQLLVARVGELAGALEGAWAAIAERGVRGVRRHDERLLAHARHLARGTRVALDGSAARLDAIADRSRRAAAGGPRSRPATASTATAVASPAPPGRTCAPPRCSWPPASAASPTERRGRWPRPSARSTRLDARLRALDPDRTLARGWSITRGPDGQVRPLPRRRAARRRAHHPCRRRRRALYGVAR